MSKQRTKTRVHERQHAQKNKTSELTSEGPIVSPPPFEVEDSEVSGLDIAAFFDGRESESFANVEEKAEEYLPETEGMVDELGNPVNFAEKDSGPNVAIDQQQVAQSEQPVIDDYSAALDLDGLELSESEAPVDGFAADTNIADPNNAEGSPDEDPAANPQVPADQLTAPDENAADGQGQGQGGGAGGAQGQGGGQGGGGNAGGGGGAGDLFSSSQSLTAGGSSPSPQQQMTVPPAPEVKADGSAVVQSFIAEMQGKRSQITSTAESKKSAIRAAAASQKASIMSGIEAKAAALDSAYQTT